MIEYRVDKENKLVVSRLSGYVDFAELLNWHYVLFSLEDYHHSFSGVADMRNANMDVSHEEILELVAINKEKQIVSGKWVCLVDTPVETANAMIYRNEKSDTHAMELFSTEVAAAEYLGIDVATSLNTLRQLEDVLRYTLNER